MTRSLSEHEMNRRKLHAAAQSAISEAMGTFTEQHEDLAVSEWIDVLLKAASRVAGHTLRDGWLATVRGGASVGVPIGVNDRHGNPIHFGDRLMFDKAEWGCTCEFIIELKKGRIQHPGSVSDLSNWCEIIESWKDNADFTEKSEG